MLREQLRHLAEAAKRPNVTVRILPTAGFGCRVGEDGTIYVDIGLLGPR